MTYVLINANGLTYPSEEPGTLGGHRDTRLYGRLDCPAALRAIARGGYVRNRVFFADEPTAIAAGYRPCAVCLPNEYRAWKQHQTAKSSSTSSPTASTKSPPIWTATADEHPVSGADRLQHGG